MLARIQHVAIVSENFVRETRFYEVVLGMKRSKPGSAEEEKAIRTNYALSISDGYVGMTVIGRKPGYVPGLHHYGIDVDDTDLMRVRSWRWLRSRVLSLLDRPPTYMTLQLAKSMRIVATPSTRIGFVLNPPDFSPDDDDATGG